MHRLKSFDAHRKLPSDLRESTTMGALVGLIAISVMGLLFIYEFKEFLKTEETSEMYIDDDRGGSKLWINLDVELPRMPCDIVSLDQQDVMGTHTVNIEGELHKIRINAQGDIIDSTFHVGSETDHPAEHMHHQTNYLDYERTKKAFNDKEGCRLKGYVKVNRVPGNVHISSHAYGGSIHQVFQQNGLSTIDVSHKIHHFSFGEESDLKIIKSKFGKGLLNPLDGISKVPDTIYSRTFYQYYLNVVPTTYITSRGTAYYVHQFTANGAESVSGNFPAVYFKYELYPNTIKFSQEGVGFFHFLTQLCAIIGGVYTIAGVIDSLLHKTFSSLLKKSDDNRLT